VQVDPAKPMLKAPGTKRLKLTYDEMLSSLDFEFKLRRYSKEPHAASLLTYHNIRYQMRLCQAMHKVRWCRLT